MASALFLKAIELMKDYRPNTEAETAWLFALAAQTEPLFTLG
ncbi:MAG TPA: hypothetical protein PK167_15510 [Prolixibacteraceae bacterium]|nr:hypothetical protein [Prolixibacteraceae bacterium]